MIYDALIMTAVTDELSQMTTGGKIERITQPMPFEIVLRVYAGNEKYDLLLSCDPEFARLHLTAIKRENPPNPYAFCMLLRKYLDGAKVVAFERPSGLSERIVAMRCRGYEGAVYTLLAEIMGKHSNIILLDGDGVILGAAKHITEEINRYREVLPGLLYRPPPRQSKNLEWTRSALPSLPDTDGWAGQFFSTENEAASWLTQMIAGMSPILVREIISRAEKPWTSQSLWNAFDEIHAAVRAISYSPIVWIDNRGHTLGAYPIPLLSVNDGDTEFLPFPLGRGGEERAGVGSGSISLALDHAAASLGVRMAFLSARDSLATALDRARKNRRHDLGEIEKGLANAARADEYQQSGDLLQSYQKPLERGQKIVTVFDYYAEYLPHPNPLLGNEKEEEPTPNPSLKGRELVEEENVTRDIPIDPSIGRRENAERYYKKAAKARAGRTNLEDRKLSLQEEMHLLDRAESELSKATTEEHVEEIHERVAEFLAKGQRRTTPGETAHAPDAPRFEGHKIRTFRSVDGWEILVGENATSNDYLTTKIASPADIWLHVRAATSAHGIIRSQNRPASVSPAAIRHAAELVAARSEVKHSSLIPVDYMLKKYVRKPRKSAPGAVTYQNEKTIYVNGIHGGD